MADLLTLALDLGEVASQVAESPGVTVAQVRRDDVSAYWCVGHDPDSRVFLVEVIESNAQDVQFRGVGDTLDEALRAVLRAELAEVDRRATHPAVAAARAALERPR